MLSDFRLELERVPNFARRTGPEEKLALKKPIHLAGTTWAKNLIKACQLSGWLNMDQKKKGYIRLEEGSKFFNGSKSLSQLTQDQATRYPKWRKAQNFQAHSSTSRQFCFSYQEGLNYAGQNLLKAFKHLGQLDELGSIPSLRVFAHEIELNFQCFQRAF